ncbi:MAG: hypothetical protein RLZZ453_133 [Chlamydiota bacterium]|jgi:hypothetical protein
MNNRFIVVLTALSFTLSPLLKADAPNPPPVEESSETMPAPVEAGSSLDQQEPVEETFATTGEEQTEQEREKEVGPGSNQHKMSAKRRQLKNIAIAACAVAVAVVAMILVSTNDGHAKN